MQAVEGIQAGRLYYTAMCPVEYLTGLFKYNDYSLPPAMRSQRVLNKARIPEMRDYILDGDYTFSALTASVDGDFEFKKLDSKNNHIGVLHIDSNARVIINDGQHRREALIEALKLKPELRHEHIVIVFYADCGLNRSQQIFSDLNRYAIRPTKSLNILYDNREDFARLVRESIEEIKGLKGRIEKEKTAISNRSKDLYTLSGVYFSIEQLTKNADMPYDEMKRFVVNFYNAAFDNIQEWQQAIVNKIQPFDYRKEYITAHTIFIKALGRVGRLLYDKYGEDFISRLAKFSGVNFRKNNPELQGTIMYNGKINGAEVGVSSLVNYIMSHIGEEVKC